MSVFTHPRFLSFTLWADAASCAGCGLLQLAAAGAMAEGTGLPPGLLRGTGVFLLVYALCAALMARRAVPPRGLVGLVVIGNLGWALGCGLLLLRGLGTLTPLGTAWVLVQAVTVLVLAGLQWTGLRRSHAAGGVALA